MLAKILEDMWVEPELLEALNEEQKKILFLKMREEQVRRWKEREEREEREGSNNMRPKKASSKHVSWLLGRDGDVSVSIIGEMDEFRSSKLLRSLMNNSRHTDNMNGIQTADLLPGREAQQLGFKDNVKLPLADVDDDAASSNELSSEEDFFSADDDLKDSTEDSDNGLGGSSDNISDWDPLRRPHFGSHGNRPLKAQLSGTERASLQDRETLENCGRVAELKKAFTCDNCNASPACPKPPVPAKPAHLRGKAHSRPIKSASTQLQNDTRP